MESTTYSGVNHRIRSLALKLRLLSIGLPTFSKEFEILLSLCRVLVLPCHFAEAK